MKYVIPLMVAALISCVLIVIGTLRYFGTLDRALPTGTVVTIGVCDYLGLCGATFDTGVHCLVSYPVLNTKAQCRFYYP